MAFENPFSSERRARRRIAAQRAELQARCDFLSEELDAITRHEDIVDEFEAPIATKRGEEVLLALDDVGLIESRAGARYRGKSMGASIKVAKGVYLRPGMHGGEITQGPDELKNLDSGTFCVTSRRCVFAGSRQNRVWEYSKLVSIDYSTIFEGSPTAMISVENRQKTSGVILDRDALPYVQSRLGFGVALFNEQDEHYLQAWSEDVAEIRAELAELAEG